MYNKLYMNVFKMNVFKLLLVCCLWMFSAYAYAGIPINYDEGQNKHSCILPDIGEVAFTKKSLNILVPLESDTNHVFAFGKTSSNQIFICRICSTENEGESL